MLTCDQCLHCGICRNYKPQKRTCEYFAKPKPRINPGDECFGNVIISAAEYSIKNESHTEKTVMEYIRYLLPFLNTGTISTMERKLTEEIDSVKEPERKKRWKKIIREINSEIKRREKL